MPIVEIHTNHNEQYIYNYDGRNKITIIILIKFIYNDRTLSILYQNKNYEFKSNYSHELA